VGQNWTADEPPTSPHEQCPKPSSMWVKKMQQTSTNHPPVITIFKGDINKSFPVMAGKNGIVLPT